MVEEDQKGCWIWQRKPNPSGYATVTIEGKRNYVHRVFYEAYVGPIAEGLQIDHLCKVLLCVNPDHLEAVSPRVNLIRSAHPNWVAHRTGTCRKGHQLESRPDSTGRNHCRTCKNERRRRPSDLDEIGKLLGPGA